MIYGKRGRNQMKYYSLAPFHLGRMACLGGNDFIEHDKDDCLEKHRSFYSDRLWELESGQGDKTCLG
jgi:hypothetical protein